MWWMRTAHQLAVDEDAEPVAIGRVVEIVGDDLVAGFLDEAVQPIGLVAQAVYGLYVLAALAPPVFGALQQLGYPGGKRRSAARSALVIRILVISIGCRAKRR